ncbi:MAG: NAD(P)-binding protein [Elusimicrobia bacterium]|nr:NAD(P)-binding protein [Elusimicrobiota bacterium]
MKNIIIGAGITGLSAAYHMADDCIILEKEGSAGGLCRSVRAGGYTFDYTGHLLHLRNPYTKRLIFNLLRCNIKKIKRDAWIFSHDTYTRYPFQANLYGLPHKVIADCLSGLIEAKIRQQSGRRPAASGGVLSFRDWTIKTFGMGFAKHFFFPYNRKLWTVDESELTDEWVASFVPNPTLEETILGAFTMQTKQYGYNASFYYPVKGGIQSLIDALLERIRSPLLNTPAIKIDMKKKRITSTKGAFTYKNIISTMPLPELLNIIENVPQKMKAFGEKLRWNSVMCFNLGYDATDINDSKHWVYFPEKKFMFYRAGFYHNFSKFMAPAGKASLYVEVSHTPGEKPDPYRTASALQRQLMACGIAKRDKSPGITNILPMPYAYIIYDRNRTAAVREIHSFLNKNGIYSIGRFGGWKYSYIEESILDSKTVVEKIKGA